MRYLFLLALLPLAAHGQGTSYQRRALAAQPEAQAEASPGPRGLVYLAAGGLRYTDPGTAASARALGLDVRYLAAGYEQQFSRERWSWGATLRLAGSADAGPVVQPGLLLRHRSALGPLTFGQRLAAEYALGDVRLDPAYSLLPAYVAASRTLLRLRLDLYPTSGLALGDNLRLTPRLSFEPALFLRLQQAAGDPDKRTIDYTGLRADVTASFARARLDVTPWVALQTQYLRTLILTSPGGAPTSNGKLNVTLPTLGLEARYHLSRPAEGQLTLPTQH